MGIKITSLPVVSLPYSGSEQIALVQSGTTKVGNLSSFITSDIVRYQSSPLSGAIVAGLNTPAQDGANYVAMGGDAVGLPTYSLLHGMGSDYIYYFSISPLLSSTAYWVLPPYSGTLLVNSRNLSDVENITESLTNLGLNSNITLSGSKDMTGSISTGSYTDFSNFTRMNMKVLPTGGTGVIEMIRQGTGVKGNIQVDGLRVGLGGLNNTGNGYSSRNVAIGLNALQNNTSTVNHNTAVGNETLKTNTTGFNNTAIGSQTLLYNTTGNNNTGAGYNTLTFTTLGSNNTAIGSEALRANTTGANNTAIGSGAISTNTTGNNNTAVGFEALDVTTGDFNTGVGVAALRLNTTGDENTAVGGRALASNTSGTLNTAIGHQALSANRTGSRNVTVGGFGLYLNTTGVSNVGVGTSSLYYNLTGSNNIALGDRAGTFTNLIGFLPNNNPSNSVFIGTEASALSSTQTNQIVIGYQAQGLGSDTAVIGNTSIKTTQLGGTLKLPIYTVATLPLPATVPGQRTFVSDSTTTTFNAIVTGGGSNFIPIFSTGNVWRVG